MPKRRDLVPESSRTPFDILSDQMIGGQHSCLEIASKNLEVAQETHNIMDTVVGTLNKEIDVLIKLVMFCVVVICALAGVEVASLVGWL